MKIGRIPYLNVFPYYHGLDVTRWGPWVEGPPRRLGELARIGGIDAAPLPVVDTFGLEKSFEPLGRWGIACRGAVRSVLFFSRQPFDQLSGARVVLTEESAASAALVRLLLEEANPGRIRFERGDDPRLGDGYLVIGDRALRMRRQPGFPCCTDLGEAWLRRTGLPFVFARWVVRRSIPEAVKTALGDALAQAVRAPLPEEIPNAAGLSAPEAKAYLRNIVHELDDSCLAGLNLFRENFRAFV